MTQEIESIDGLRQDLLQRHEAGAAALPALGDLEYALLGAIDDLGCRPPFRRVSAGRDVAADLDELAQHRVVADDAPVGANVGRARRVLDEAREIRQPAGRLELPEALQVLADGDGIGRLVALDERGDRPKISR